MRSFTVLLLLLVAIAACSAFAPVSRTAAHVPKISLSMADTEVEEIKTPKTLPDPSDRPKNIVKNIPKGEVREVKWVDDGKKCMRLGKTCAKLYLFLCLSSCHPSLQSSRLCNIHIPLFAAPTANVDFAMSWGYLFVVLPGALFLNDIFHVVPKGTWGIF